MKRQKITEIVASIIPDKPRCGLRLFMSCRAGWTYSRYITDEEKASIEKALSKAGYTQKEVGILRIGKASSKNGVWRTDLGNNVTLIARK